MKKAGFPVNNRLFENFGSFAVVTLLAVAGGLAFVHLGSSPTYQAMLILMAAGGLGILLLTQFGITRQFLLFGIGFAVAITPVKYFGFQEGDSYYMWAVQTVTFSAFDAALLIFMAFYARNIVSTLYRRLPRPVIVLVLGYLGVMLLSMTEIGPAGHMDVAVSQFIHEIRCLMVFAVLFTLIHNPGPSGLMADLRCILIGLSCVAALETAIVFLEYVGALQAGPLLMGIRVGSFRESLGMDAALRVGGTFQHPNYLVIFAGAAFLLLWQTEMDSHPEAGHSILYWPGIVGGFVCMIMTLSRSGWAGTGAGTVFYVFVMLVGRGWPWLRSLPWKYVVPSLLFIAAVGLVFSDSIISKLFHSDSGNVDSRHYTNNVAVMLWAESPWLGRGLGQHGFLMAGMAKFVELRTALKAMPSVHNSYLLILTEIGIVGTVLYFLVPVYALFSGMMTCLKNPNHRATAILCGACTAVIIYLVADLASISLRHINLSVLYWFLLGIVIGLSTLIREGGKAS